MKFDIKISNSKISSLVKSFSSDLQNKLDKALFKAAIEGRRLIRERTKRGISLDGGRFERYTADYAEFRKRKGRSSKPNLLFSGNMLGSIIVLKRRGYSVIKFSRLSEALKAKGNQNKRPFFGLNKDDKAKLTRFVRGKL